MEANPVEKQAVVETNRKSVGSVRRRISACLLLLCGAVCAWMYWPDAAWRIRHAGGTVERLTAGPSAGGIHITLPDTVGDVELERLTSLDTLDPVWLQLRGRQITGRGLQSLTRLKNLHGITLWGTSITDDDLLMLAEFPKMTTVILEGTQMSGRGLEHLSKMPKVQLVNVWFTPLKSEDVLRFQAEHPKIRVLSQFTDKVDDD
jgi:hypothetical protein